MDTDVYKKLADHLDRLPGSFPATDSGVELSILKRLFTPHEAEIAMKLSLKPETAAMIAQRLQTDESEVSRRLEDMSKKGLIFRLTKDGEKNYMATQFVVGIWEYHVNGLNKELIHEVNEYIPHIAKNWFKQKTKLLRVIPVSQSISAGMNIMPYEAAEKIIRQQSKIVVAPCICRKEREMVGEGCGKPLEVCLVFAGGAYFYEENGLGRSISQEDALEILKKGAEAGLVLQPGNSQKPMNICLCCGCCCQILKNLNALESPAKAVCSNFYAAVNEENCIGCGNCAERCQMKAIVVEDTAHIKAERCIGCGLCVTACDVDALRLVEKQASEQYVPPKHVTDTYKRIAKERGLI
jgi:ferredoxin/predicted transcriptional regulator